LAHALVASRKAAKSREANCYLAGVLEVEAGLIIAQDFND